LVIEIRESDDGTKQALADALKMLQEGIGEGKEIRKELGDVWKKIRDDAKALCRIMAYDTGTLWSTIRISSIPTGTMLGGFSKIKAITIFEGTIIAGDITKINPKSNKPCDYAMWVHDGHRDKSGKMVPPKPFLTESIAKNEDELNKAIDRALKKLGKRYGSV